jgi:DNA-binding transcriptional LysR family regulator
MFDQLRQMAIFAKTIDHGSFRGAARELRISPSVVSHHISQLEENLGVALLYRSTRKLSLTPEGERLLAAAYKMLEAAEGEILNLSSSARKPSGELRLTVPSVLSHSHLTELIGRFSMTYPGISLSIDFSDTRKDMIEGKFDVAIRMGLEKKKSASSKLLFYVKRRLVAAKDYVKNRPLVTTPDDLLEWDWLELAPVRQIMPSFVNAKQERVTIKPIAHISANDAHALYRLALAGAGLTIIPDFLTYEGIKSGEVVHVLPDWEPDRVKVYADWPSNAPKNGLIKLLIDELSKEQIFKA